MIDGRHRMTKMRSMGLREANFNLIDYSTIIKLLEPYGDNPYIPTQLRMVTDKIT